jgi:1-acyl-sn-glycerol-3-phosphate acyltransferase
MKNIWTTLGIYTATILWTVVSLLLSPVTYAWFRFIGSLSSEEAVRKLVWIYGRVWVLLANLFIPVHLADGDFPSPCVIVANHASFFDMYFIGGQPLWNVCFAVRDWPFRIPFYLPFMKAARYVRTETNDLEEIVEQSKATLANGASMFFFPEGTRSPDGTLSRFRSGAFRVALEAGVPVVPLCIAGTHQLLPKGKLLLNRAKVEVRLLPPVYPDTYKQVANGHVQMRKDIKHRMAQTLVEIAGIQEPNARSCQ